MRLEIRRFPLSNFRELTPLLLRCFPEFWEPRLALGLYSFPYDLRLFAGRIGGRLVACAGIHDYQVVINDRVSPLGGLCDVAVDPDFRARGFARQMQDYILEYCREKVRYCAMPLYTDKPGVYLSRGWQIYESSRNGEISTADFPAEKVFSLATGKLNLKAICRAEAHGLSGASARALEITRIYTAGHRFPGKCLRSEKTWNELFAEPKHQWQLDKDTYFLYREQRLIEAYSRGCDHAVNKYLPAHGGHDDNKVMIKILDEKLAEQSGLLESIVGGSLVFPLADVF